MITLGGIQMIFKNWKKEILTIPNMLSLFRLVLIPVYVTIYLNAKSDADYVLAAMILAVSCLTDLIDGKIARHFNMISNLGKLLDPVADKATQFTLMICLAIRYKMFQNNGLWFMIGLFFIKEAFQLIAGGLRLRKGRMLKGAQMTGKICTTVLFISLILMVMIPNLSQKTINIFVLVDTIFLVIAFIDYIIVYFRKDSKFQDLNSENE